MNPRGSFTSREWSKHHPVISCGAFSATTKRLEKWVGCIRPISAIEFSSVCRLSWRHDTLGYQRLSFTVILGWKTAWNNSSTQLRSITFTPFMACLVWAMVTCKVCSTERRICPWGKEYGISVFIGREKSTGGVVDEAALSAASPAGHKAPAIPVEKGVSWRPWRIESHEDGWNMVNCWSKFCMFKLQVVLYTMGKRPGETHGLLCMHQEGTRCVFSWKQQVFMEPNVFDAYYLLSVPDQYIAKATPMWVANIKSVLPSRIHCRPVPQWGSRGSILE